LHGLTSRRLRFLVNKYLGNNAFVSCANINACLAAPLYGDPRNSVCLGYIMSTFKELERLAKNTSSESRRELLRGLTDLFLENMGEDTQGDAFSDVISKVLDDVVEEARGEFASRVSMLEQFPKEIVVKLAWDTFEVAAPVLENSTVLTDDDLVQVAQSKSDEHLMAISKRSEIGETVTDVLIERGSDGVVHLVAENPGAQLSTTGYSALADKAQIDKKLQAKIIRREDVTPEIAIQIEPYLSAQLKKRLDTKMSNAGGGVDGLVEKAKARVEKALVGEKRDIECAQKLIQEVSDGVVSLDEAVEKLAKTKRPKPLSALLANAADLPESMISNTMLKVNGTPLAIACKAMRISSEAFAEIAAMRCKVLKLPSSNGDRLAEQYSELNEADADRTMRFLRVRHSLSEQGGAENAA